MLPLDVVVTNIGYLLTFIALAVKEIYWLRIILTLAQILQFTHAYLTWSWYGNDPSKMVWTFLFVIINVIQIVILYLNRREIPIPEEIKDLYDNIFHTKSKREFLKFWDAGKVCQIENDTIIKTGDKQSDLMLILNGTADVVRGKDKVATLERGQFIAEISYITGNGVSADVSANGELLFYTWSRERLEKLRKNNPKTKSKLDRILTLDMANKLVRK